MRFEVNVDCTPEEARQFFGLPDILPMQQDLMEMVSRRLSENIQTMEADKLVQTWLPAMFQGWSDMQTHFWNQMTQMGGKMGSMGPMGTMNFNVSPSSSKNKDDEQKASKQKKK